MIARTRTIIMGSTIICRALHTALIMITRTIYVVMRMGFKPIFSSDFCTDKMQKPVATELLLFLFYFNVVCLCKKMLGNRKIRTLRACRLAARQKLRMLFIYYMLQLQMVNREIWIHPLNEDRARKGEFFHLYCDQRYLEDKFFENYRMSVAQFDEILRKITPLIKKKDTNFRKAITPEEKLSITLRYIYIFRILLVKSTRSFQSYKHLFSNMQNVS